MRIHITNVLLPAGRRGRRCFSPVSELDPTCTSVLFHLLRFASYDGPYRPGRAGLHSSMNIVDLRQTTVRQLESLLEEEASHWRDELHWDYRGALDLIKRFLEAHALCGSVAV